MLFNEREILPIVLANSLRIRAYPQNFEQKIGFDQIRQLLKDKCLSTLGEEKVSDMGFSEQYEVVEENLNQVTDYLLSFHIY